MKNIREIFVDIEYLLVAKHPAFDVFPDNDELKRRK